MGDPLGPRSKTLIGGLVPITGLQGPSTGIPTTVPAGLVPTTAGNGLTTTTTTSTDAVCVCGGGGGYSCVLTQRDN